MTVLGITLATVTASRALGIASGCVGAIGAWILYRYSFTLESFPAYMNHEMIKAQGARNRKRRTFQKWGFGLVSAGFVLQVLSQLVP